MTDQNDRGAHGSGLGDDDRGARGSGLGDQAAAPPPWREDARNWAQGRDWRWRAALMAYLAYTAFRGVVDPMSWNWWAGITLGVHEAGHILFSPFGEFLAVAGGSIMQLAAPLLVAYLMKRQRDWFGVAVGGTWLGSSLASLATYIGDARAQELPLVGFTDQPVHDWYYLLARTGLLRHDTQIAGITRFIAVVVLVGAVLFTVWLCVQMRRPKAGSRLPGVDVA
jgi:hypothetical protein